MKTRWKSTKKKQFFNKKITKTSKTNKVKESSLHSVLKHDHLNSKTILGANCQKEAKLVQ